MTGLCFLWHLWAWLLKKIQCRIKTLKKFLRHSSYLMSKIPDLWNILIQTTRPGGWCSVSVRLYFVKVIIHLLYNTARVWLLLPMDYFAWQWVNVVIAKTPKVLKEIASKNMWSDKKKIKLANFFSIFLRLVSVSLSLYSKDSGSAFHKLLKDFTIP